MFTDRYYTSIPLAQALADRSTSFTGTSMRNRAELPDPIHLYTVEPPNRGHFGTVAFVLSSEVVLFSEVV